MSDRISAFRASALAGTCLLVLGLTGCGDPDAGNFDTATQTGPNPVLPEPNPPLLQDLKLATVIGWAEGETPQVPAGLKIAPYAKDLANPRTVQTLPNGDVLVAQSRAPAGNSPKIRPKDIIRGWIMAIAHGDDRPQKPSNKITLLRDSNRDGQVDEQHDLLTDMHSPFGIAFADNTLYIAATDAILAYPYTPGQNEITAAPRVLTALPAVPVNHHWTKDLALSPDGRFLYVTIGSNSNAGENGLEAEKGRAAIWEVDRQTGAARIFGSGLRNPNGVTFHPQTGELWAVINERDELGPNLVPDYLTSVKDGAFYGWPWSYYGNHVDPRVKPERPDMVQRAIAPDYALSSHVAALGLTFSMNSALPPEFANGAFIGEHGSWNRLAFNGYKVAYVPFENGRPSGALQEVVTGFLKGDEVRGRPVGVGIDGTGALLVADDAGNTVWRVSAADGRVSPAPIGTDQAASGQAGAAPAGDTAASPAPAPAAPAAEGSSAPTPSTTEVAPAVLPPEGYGDGTAPAPAQ